MDFHRDGPTKGPRVTICQTSSPGSKGSKESSEALEFLNEIEARIFSM